MAGVSLGGPVTLEALVMAFNQGLRLAAVLICFGAVNSLCSPYRMLRALPAALYEAGVAVTVALSFAPQAVMQAGRIREARRLRGRPVRGLAALRGMALPVLEGALDRSVALAASMDTRGYGRRADGGARAPSHHVGHDRRSGCWRSRSGSTACSTPARPRPSACPLLGLGSVALAASLFAGGRRAVRTRYRPDPWRLPEWIVGALGPGRARRHDRSPPGCPTAPLALNPPAYPLTWPTLPLVAVAGIAVALLPSVAAPRPPAFVAPPAVRSPPRSTRGAPARRAGRPPPSRARRPSADPAGVGSAATVA